MARGTRSGQFQKDEDTSSSRRAGGKVKDMKGSTSSGSAASDSPNLRRSTRETPTKKMSTLSPSPRKSERLENQTPSSSSDKRKLERVEKIRSPSSLRRSGRIEMNGVSSSSGSKKSSNSSNSLGKQKKKKEENNGKLKVVGINKQSKENKVDRKSVGLSKKRKRLDAHSYRSFLRPQAKITKSSEEGRRHRKEDSALQEDTINSGASHPKEMQGGGDDCNWGKGQELKLSDQCCKEYVEGSSSGSREFAGLTAGNDARSKKRKVYSLEASEFKDESNSSVSKCSDFSSQSSPVIVTDKKNGGGAIERGIDGEGDIIVAYRLNRKELISPELVESTSEERSPAVDVDPESGGNLGASRSGNMTDNLVSDYSVTLLDKEISIRETSTAHASSSSPLRSKNKNMEQSTLCCQPQRVHSDWQAHEMCSFNSETRHDLSISSPEEACKPVAMLGDPCKGVAVTRCSKEDKVEGVLKPETRDQSAGPKKQNSLIASPHTIYVTVPMGEDRGRLRVNDSTGSAEEHLSSAESSLAIQRATGPNACGVCKKPGLLLCCDGKDCKRSYHLCCLDPPLKDIPLGAWLCLSCVKKELESGVYSVSEGKESVWDIKEGMKNGKHYLVKYKGLAHVHNRWIPESQMLLEAPMLLAKFNRRHQKEKVIRWKQEWTEPHRLLQKRLLMPLKLVDEYFSGHGNNSSHCYYEWFVKWKGLGYEHATWEFENSSFLCSSEAISLIKDYERRHEEAKEASDPSRADKALQVKKNPFHKLLRLPDGFPPGLDNDHLNSINRLCEFWHRSQNAVFLDDQERIIKSILFILALQCHTCRPFLIISTISSLSVWESEFARLAPSINIVVYGGNKNVRKMIRTVEFYEEGGCIMFQVLLSHPDAIVEDFEALDCIGWEVVIVDECQYSRVSKHFEKLKHLSTDFRLLLLSGQLKDNLAEYLNLLSFLDSGGKENCVSSLKFDSKDTIGALAILKERLTRYLAYERKPDSSKFLEYWVPVLLSNVQLEQYCVTLLSSSIALRSCSKIDHVGALRDILISTRKCCDHPYIVDPLLQSSLTKGLPAGEYLDIGVNASGKLFLLDKILHVIKNQGLRVLILFQSIGGAGRNSIGDILDDFLRQRFGADSYERVDSGLIMSKKLAALNMFNDEARGRFVFLIENRACLPSIKLSSVDAVIIFDSDWNPLNDLRALQRISIESQFEQVKVFRLYSSYTVEEKVLIFAKQDMILESNIQNISRSVSHSLLSWGASYLFSKLDEFHQHDKLNNSSETSTDKLFVNDVVLELSTQLPNKAEGSDTSNCSILIKAQYSGMSYSRNIVLVGEKEGISSLDKDPSGFWSNLLEGRYPQWRYISRSSQRIRRKVQNFDELAKVPEAENEEGKRKRRKLGSDTIDPISLQTWLQDKRKEAAIGKDSMLPDNLPPLRGPGQSSPISPMKPPVSPSSIPKEPGTEASRNQVNVGSEDMPHSPSVVNNGINNLHIPPMSDDIPELHKPHMVESEERGKLRNAQRSLHLLLKPELSKLCETLKLPEDVKCMAEILLEYIMNNHHVSRESETILQAFRISLCWRAASLLKHNVDHKESLALAKKYLNFECDEDQAYSVYLKLRILKKKFSRRTGALRDHIELNSSEDQSSASTKDVPTEPLFGQTSKSALSGHPVSEVDKTRESSDGLWCIHGPIEQEKATVLETPAKLQEHIGSLKDELLKKRIDLIEKICSRREEELLLKQQVELSDFNIQREEEKIKLKKAYDSELGVTRSIILDSTVRNYKIKLLNLEFSKKMAAFDQHMKFQRRKLALMQADARNKERQIKDRWLEEAKAGRIAEFFDNLPLSDSGFMLEVFMVGEKDGACEGSESKKLISRPSSDQPCNNANTTGPAESIESTVEFCEIPAIIPNGVVGNIPVVTKPPGSQCNNMNEMEPFEPIGTSAGIPATVSPGVACEMTVETESPATVLPGVAGDMPNGGVENVIVEPEALASQCNNITVVEPIGPIETSLENPTTALHGMAGDLPMETVSSASHSDIMNTVGNRIDAVLTASGTATIVDTVQRAGTDASDGPFLISALQNRAELSSLANVSTSCVCENSVPSNQVPSVGEHDRLDMSVGVRSDRGFSSSQRIVVPVSNSVGCEPSQVEQINYNPMVANSLPLQSPPSTDISLVEHTQGNIPGPIASEEEHSYQTHFSTQQTEVLMQQRILAAPVQVAQSDQLVSHSDMHLLPPSATTTGRTCSEDLSSTCYQTHCSTRQTEVLMQQPIVAAAVQAEQSDDQLVSHDVHPLPTSATTPGRTCSEDLSSTCYQTHCSTQQTEVLMQQPIVAAAQVEQSDQVVSHDLHPLPPSATTPGTCFGDLNSTFYQIHYSTRQTVLMQQPTVVAAVQVDQSNQLVSQSVAHPLPPSASTPERTCSEELSSNGIQPESGNRFLQNLALTNWMPPQGLHPDPLQNELMKIRRQQDLCIKMQEDKKLRIKMECDQEMEKVRRKYDALLQDSETEFLRDKNILETIYNKVLMNRVLAEQFRAKFIESRGGSSASSQGSRTSYMQQFLQASQSQLAQRPSLPSTPFPTPATLPPVPMSAPDPAPTPPSHDSARLRAPASAVSSGTSAQVPRHTSPVIFSNNPIRPHFSPTFPRANLQVGSEPRAPAPHLHRFRPHAATSSQSLPLQIGGVTSQQQQPLANLGAAPSLPLQIGGVTGQQLQPLANLGSAPSLPLQIGDVMSQQLQTLANLGPAPSLPLQIGGVTKQQQQPLANLGSASSIPLPIAPIPPTPSSMAPGGPGLPVCHVNSLSPVDLPGDSHVGADLPNLSPTPITELVPGFERWLSSNQAVLGIEVPPSSMDTRTSTATADVVCISDDE